MPATPLESPLARPPIAAADVAGWLEALGVAPVGSAEREGVSSWDLVLDGRRRFDVRITVILDPAVALVTWVHLAPPITDSFRSHAPQNERQLAQTAGRRARLFCRGGFTPFGVSGKDMRRSRLLDGAAATCGATSIFACSTSE